VLSLYACVRLVALTGLLAFLVVVVPSAVDAAGLKPVKGQLEVKYRDRRPEGVGLLGRAPARAGARLRPALGRLGCAAQPRRGGRPRQLVNGARSMGSEALITFARSSGKNGRVAPSADAFLVQFRRFRKRYPAVKAYAAWNEANHCGIGTCKKPQLVARYFDSIRRNCSGCRSSPPTCSTSRT